MYISIKVKKMEYAGFPVIVVKFTDCNELVRSFQKEISKQAQSQK